MARDDFTKAHELKRRESQKCSSLGIHVASNLQYRPKSDAGADSRAALGYSLSSTRSATFLELNHDGNAVCPLVFTQIGLPQGPPAAVLLEARFRNVTHAVNSKTVCGRRKAGNSRSRSIRADVARSGTDAVSYTHLDVYKRQVQAKRRQRLRPSRDLL